MNQMIFSSAQWRVRNAGDLSNHVHIKVLTALMRDTGHSSPLRVTEIASHLTPVCTETKVCSRKPRKSKDMFNWLNKFGR